MEDISLVLLVLMIFPFTQRNARRTKFAPGSGAHESEKQELGIVPVALRQRLDRQQRAPIFGESRGRVTELVTIFLAGKVMRAYSRAFDSDARKTWGGLMSAVAKIIAAFIGSSLERAL
jgi:hypothetical protein